MEEQVIYTEPARIMLVEDDLAQAILLKRILDRHSLTTEVCHFDTGGPALDYLFGNGDGVELKADLWPHLIFLDIHLPGIDGIEVLRQIKASEYLRRIPVIMLSCSGLEEDVQRAYDNHANSYLVKPCAPGAYAQLIDNVLSYWLVLNHHPDLTTVC